MPWRTTTGVRATLPLVVGRTGSGRQHTQPRHFLEAQEAHQRAGALRVVPAPPGCRQRAALCTGQQRHTPPASCSDVAGGTSTAHAHHAHAHHAHARTATLTTPAAHQGRTGRKVRRTWHCLRSSCVCPRPGVALRCAATVCATVLQHPPRQVSDAAQAKRHDLLEHHVPINLQRWRRRRCCCCGSACTCVCRRACLGGGSDAAWPDTPVCLCS